MANQLVGPHILSNVNNVGRHYSPLQDAQIDKLAAGNWVINWNEHSGDCAMAGFCSNCDEPSVFIIALNFVS